MIPEDWRRPDAEELHELRKRVVIHRYQMDIVEPAVARFAKMWTGGQRRANRLGRHQDMLMLESLTRADQPWHAGARGSCRGFAERRAGTSRLRPPAARLFVRSRRRSAAGSPRCGGWGDDPHLPPFRGRSRSSSPHFYLLNAFSNRV